MVHQRGFSLIELLIGLGVSLTVALGTASLLMNNIKTQQNKDAAANVFYTKKNIQYSINGWKTGDPLPIEIANTDGCFNQNRARTDEGIPINIILPEGKLEAGKTYGSGGARYEIKEISLSNAEKVSEDHLKATYLGLIYMQTKTVGSFVGQRKLVSSLLVSVSPPPAPGSTATVVDASNCPKLSRLDVYDTKMGQSDFCNSIRGHIYATDSSSQANSENGRCIRPVGFLRSTVGNASSCSAVDGGLPIFHFAEVGQRWSRDLYCPVSAGTKCVDRYTGGDAISRNAVFRGVEYSQNDLNQPIALADCKDAMIASFVAADSNMTSGTVRSAVSQTVASFAEQNCLEAQDNNMIDPVAIQCGLIDRANYSRQYQGMGTSAADPIGASQTRPAQYVSVDCQCGELIIAHNQFCGYGYLGRAGFANDANATAVYRCESGRLVLEPGAYVASEDSSIQQKSGQVSRVVRRAQKEFKWTN